LPAHLAYGLRLATNVPIPGLHLQPHTQTTDVQVWLGKESLPPFRSANSLQFIYRTPAGEGRDSPSLRVAISSSGQYFFLFYRDGARFAVERQGQEVWGDWPDDYTLEDACTYLLGPVMGFILRLRGTCCLHASAVAVGNGAVALVGPPGAGKSTLAAAFGRSGFPVLSDDIAALCDKGTEFLVQPGYPRVNLWPDSASALFGFDNALPHITPNWDKRYLALGENGHRFATEPLTLRTIYILGEREADLDEAIFEEVAGGDAFMELVTNSYVNYLLDRDMRSQEFKALGRIVSNIPVRRIRPTTNHADLHRFCGAIATDAMRFSTAEEPLGAPRLG